MKDIADLKTLREYARQVIERANHHAQEVDRAVLMLLGVVLWRGDRVRVFERESTMGNVLWVKIGDRLYAFGWKKADRAIVVRDGSIRGPIVAKFSNKTLGDIKEFFESLD